MARIPKKAKRVFKGILFDVYQWQQKMFDGKYATFEMLERGATVDNIAVVGNKIMVLMQEQPTKPLFPSLAGGKIEKKETPLATAKRELLEETGYKASRHRLLAEFFGNSKEFFHEYLFVADDCKKMVEQNLDNGEKIKINFFAFDKFLELCRDPRFTAPLGFKFMMYEALIDKKKKAELKKKIFDKRK